jgi:predicted  nucleic acid-binding Zn-ribbon protein
MRVAKKNKSQIDGIVKSREFRELMKEEWESSMDTLRPLMQEIDELENEIDAIVFDLYDLTEEEVETVLDSLDTGEDEKKEILEEFREAAK